MKYDDAGFKKVIADPRYQDIGNLPSNFFPYPGSTKLYARPFTVNELRLVSKAAVLKDVSHLLRAVDLVTTMDAGWLTIGDFYYVLMWLRIQSMPKTPYIMEWDCAEIVVVEKATGKWLQNDETFKMPEDESNYRVEPCDTRNNEIIHMTNIDIVCLEDDFAGIPNDGPIEFDFPRACLLQDIQVARADPETKLLVRAAQWVKEGVTIEDKINILSTQDDCDAFDQAEAIDEKIVHGISETTVLTCRKCGKKDPHQIVLDALSFFR